MEEQGTKGALNAFQERKAYGEHCEVGVALEWLLPHLTQEHPGNRSLLLSE
jgi:hypothetical protein